MITRIEDQNGQVVRQFSAQRNRVVEAEDANAVASMLQQDIIEPSAVRATSGEPGAYGSAAGISGSTTKFTDAWFVGFTSRYAAVVWVGFDDGRPIGLGATGAELAAPIWADFMRLAQEEIGSIGDGSDRSDIGSD